MGACVSSFVVLRGNFRIGVGVGTSVAAVDVGDVLVSAPVIATAFLFFLPLSAVHQHGMT